MFDDLFVVIFLFGECLQSLHSLMGLPEDMIIDIVRSFFVHLGSAFGVSLLCLAE